MPTPEEIIEQHRHETGFYVIRRPDGTIREIGTNIKVYYSAGISVPSPPTGEISVPVRHVGPPPPERVIVAPPPVIVPKPGIKAAIVRRKEAMEREAAKLKEPIKGVERPLPYGVRAGRQALRGVVFAPAAAKETVEYAYKHPVEAGVGLAAFAGLGAVSPVLPVAAVGGIAAYEIAKGRPEYAVSDILIAGGIGTGVSRATKAAKAARAARAARAAAAAAAKAARLKAAKLRVPKPIPPVTPAKPPRDLPAALRPDRLKVDPELGTLEDFMAAYPRYKPIPPTAPELPPSMIRAREAAKKRAREAKPSEITKEFKKAQIEIVRESIKPIEEPIFKPKPVGAKAAARARAFKKKWPERKIPSPFDPKPPEIRPPVRIRKGQALKLELKVKPGRPTKLKPPAEKQRLLPVLIQDPAQKEREEQKRAAKLRMREEIEEKEKEKPSELLRDFLDMPEAETLEDVAGTLTLIGGATLLDGGLRRPPPEKPPKLRGLRPPLGAGLFPEMFPRVPKAKRRKAEYAPSLLGLFEGIKLKERPKRVTGIEIRYPIEKPKKKSRKKRNVRGLTIG